ncbi:transcriptional regulator [Listeria floridensis]|uniref:transcriptional regulator n=1 Tax=Listeria floridensis TaxID=1494962 RepID=UPI0004B3F56F|nr:transcriptional regulator [Listeria floridensis]
MNQYGVTLNVNPVSVAGSEPQIRYFFAQLFYTTYGAEAWPFQADDRESIDKLIVEHERLAGYKFVYPHRQSRFYWFEVSLERMRQGFRVELEGIYFQHFENEDKLGYTFETFEQETGVSFERGDIYGIKLLQLEGLQYDDDNTILKTLAFFGKYAPEVKRQAEALLADIVSGYGHEPENADAVLLQLLAYLIYLKQFTEFDSFVVSKRGYVTNMLQSEFPHFCQSIVKATQKNTFEAVSAETVIFLLGTMWEDLIDESKRELTPIRILVASQLSVSNTRFLKKMVNIRFREQVELVEMKETALTEEYLRREQIDFVLADFIVSAEIDVPIVEINYYPSDRDWRNIRHKIRAIQEKKG